MAILRIDTAEVFLPLLEPSRYKGAWGGRGSGKSHFFAERLIEDCIIEPGDSGEGLRSVCIREVQKDLAQSSKLLIETKLKTLGITEADGFKVFRDVIQTPKDGLMIFKGMNDYTADSIKSLEGFKRAWWEEAQTATLHSLNLLRPTLRASGSELWFSWNPRKKTDPIDMILRGVERPTGSIVVKANWRDNPWLTEELKQERLDYLRMHPDQYDHFWEGDYVSVIDGAYFAKHLTETKADGRIGKVAADPLMTIRLFVDIGGTGARADSFAIWAVQFVGKEIRVLNYYEAVGQPLQAHAEWLREQGYEPNKAQIWLPHDGANQDKVYDTSYEKAFKEIGYKVTVVENQGKGAAKSRIESVRRTFPNVWFNESTTEAGRDALGWYHEKKDDIRNVGLGPDHDWASHACFHEDTKVLTRYGMYRIMDLPITGEVLTPCGWKQYINPRITKRNAQLVEVVFTGGYSVKCTPDHLFLTANGWKSAQSLMKGTEIQSTLTKSHNTSTVGFIGCGRVKSIFQRAAKSFIEMSGHLHLDRYRQSAISTTKMVMSLITKLKILSALMVKSTAVYRGVSAKNYLLEVFSPHQLETRQLNGISLKRDVYGIGGMQKGLKVGQNGSEKKNLASIAERFIRRLSVKVVIPGNTVHLHANQPLTASAGYQQNMPVIVETVKNLSELADVWDITVPDGHWFSLENGAVVHNCDAFGLMSIVYEKDSKQFIAPKINYRNMGII